MQFYEFENGTLNNHIFATWSFLIPWIFCMSFGQIPKMYRERFSKKPQRTIKEKNVNARMFKSICIANLSC